MHTRLLPSISLIALSLSFFSIRATAICYLALLSILFLNPKNFRKIKFPRAWLLTLIALNIAVLSISVRHGIYLNYYIKFLALTLYTFLFFTLLRSRIISSQDITFSCRALIAVHVSLFLIQLAVYQTSGEYINFDSYIRESESEALYQTRALEDLYISIRATGLFSEPSFYAMTVLPASLLLVLQQKKLTLLTSLGILSVVASLSIAAIAITSLGLGLVLFTTKTNRAYFLAIIVLLAVASPLLMEVYDKRISESVDYDAIYSRQLIFQEFKERGTINNLFGSGFFWDEIYPIGKTMLAGYHTRDSSFYVNTFFTSGSLGIAALFSMILFALRKHPKYGVALLILLLFKFHVLSGSLWMTIILIYSFSTMDAANRQSQLSRSRTTTPTRTHTRPLGPQTDAAC